MTRITLVPSEESAPVADGEHGVKAVNVEDRNHQWRATQLSAMIWLILAWMVGTLISELEVMGADVARPPALVAQVERPHALMNQWKRQEIDLAVFHSDLSPLKRLQERAEEDRAEEWQHHVVSAGPSRDEDAEAEIETVASALPEGGAVLDGGAVEQETEPTEHVTAAANTAAANTAAANTAAANTAASIKIAFQQSGQPPSRPTRQAWYEISDQSVPDLVERVVHSFQELIAPVHVQPISSMESSDSSGGTSPPEPSVAGVVKLHVNQPVADVPVTDVPVAIAPVVAVRSSRNTKSEADDQHGAGLASLGASPSTLGASPSTLGASPLRSSEKSADAQTQIIRTPPQLLSVLHPAVWPVSTADSHPSGDPPPRMRPGQDNHRQPNLVREHEAPTVAIGNDGAIGATEAAESPTPVHVRSIDAIVPREPRLAAKWPFDRTGVSKSDGVTLNVDSADVRSVFEMLARGYQMNILVAPEVEGVVTANVEGLSPDETLRGIVKMCGLNLQREGEMIYIYSSEKIPADARQLRVFPLDFARAASLEATVQGLLSPVGNAYPNTMESTDNMQTQESIVVVDVPSAIEQIESYILQADQPPRQVMIEARVLEVELTDDMVHGVNFDAFISGDVSVGGVGFVEPVITKTNPVFYTQISGRRLNALIDFLETTTDSKTLASPRVQVINGQHARIQVGQQLGFTVATVTQTSTIQDVQFLETGVVLSVTPTISRDGRILMEVKPEVSDGEINPETLLPEEETREVETSVLLENHHGVIIGGLIQEKDRVVIKKLPWLGDVKHIGKLFQRREAVRSRSEIIVALTPHIIEACVQQERSAIEYERTETPLFHGTLQRSCRPWEPRLPDRAGDERHMDVNQLNRKIP